MKSNYLNILGLAFRARKCSTGEEVIIKAIQRNKANLILIANDIGKQTFKKITNKCDYYNVPYIIVDDRETLSHAFGQSKRVAVAILDKGFAEKLQSLLK